MLHSAIYVAINQKRWGLSFVSKAPEKSKPLLLQFIDLPAKDNQHGNYDRYYRIPAKPHFDTLPQGELLFHLHGVGYADGIGAVDIQRVRPALVPVDVPPAVFRDRVAFHHQYRIHDIHAVCLNPVEEYGIMFHRFYGYILHP